MSRTRGNDKVKPILLDSTYLLPIFGIDVYGINPDHYMKLRRLAISGKLILYYSSISFIEIIAKIARQASREGVSIDTQEITETIKIIEESDYMKPVYPDRESFGLAYTMRLLGHRDMIDNILYAMATIRKLLFLSMDKKLRDFVYTKGISGARILSHDELMDEITE